MCAIHHPSIHPLLTSQLVTFIFLGVVPEDALSATALQKLISGGERGAADSKVVYNKLRTSDRMQPRVHRYPSSNVKKLLSEKIGPHEVTKPFME